MCNILGKVPSREIPDHSDLQANMVLLANMNIYFMLKCHKGAL